MMEQGRPDVGTILREARERAGLSLRQIADATKLSVHLLTALEQNRISALPGGIYRRSIVRAFAREVGVDAETTVRAFLAQYPDEAPAAQPATVMGAATPARSRRVLSGIARALGAAIPIVAGLYYFTSNGAGPRPQPIAHARRAAEVPAAAGADVEATRAVRPDDASGPVSMTVTTAARTRLQVIADGREIVARSLDAGEEIQIAFSTDVVVRGDDAGVVHLTLNGRAVRSLGAAGVPLTVRIPRQGYRDWLQER